MEDCPGTPKSSNGNPTIIGDLEKKRVRTSIFCKFSKNSRKVVLKTNCPKIIVA
jgi:hypothetical protein